MLAQHGGGFLATKPADGSGVQQGVVDGVKEGNGDMGTVVGKLERIFRRRSRLGRVLRQDSDFSLVFSVAEALSGHYSALAAPGAEQFLQVEQ